MHLAPLQGVTGKSVRTVRVAVDKKCSPSAGPEILADLECIPRFGQLRVCHSEARESDAHVGLRASAAAYLAGAASGTLGPRSKILIDLS